MGKNKQKITVGIIIIVILAIIAIGYIMFSKAREKNAAEKFNEQFIAATNINFDNKGKLSPLFNEYLEGANTIINNRAVKATDEDYASNYGKTELNEAAGDKFTDLQNKMEKAIGASSNLNEVKRLESQNLVWENYLKEKNKNLPVNSKEFYLKKSENYLDIAAGVTYFDIYNCLIDNGINPQFGMDYFSDKLGNKVSNINTNNSYVKGQLSTINCIVLKGNDIINNAISSNGSIVDAYNKINELWTNYLNQEYEYLKVNSPKKELLIKDEAIYNKFKTAMCDEASKEYANPLEAELSSTKMNIRLTEQRAFNLLMYA